VKEGDPMAETRPSYKALLVIDMLNDFVRKGAPLWVPAAADIISSVARRVNDAREQGIPVIYLCDAHDPDDREFQDWPPHAVDGTPGARLISELSVEEKDTVIKKKGYSCFYETSLAETLKEWGTTHLFFTGLVTNICVLYTVADAKSRGYQVTVYSDAVAGLHREAHDFALKEMKEVLGAEVV
jgi:nicotinamidase/pyrazinamidase